jgi:hypothetical protein
MSLCKVCGANNPDEAAACRVCKTALEKGDSGQEIRRRTQVEPMPRVPTFEEAGGFGAGQAGRCEEARRSRFGASRFSIRMRVRIQERSQRIDRQ